MPILWLYSDHIVIVYDRSVMIIWSYCDRFVIVLWSWCDPSVIALCSYYAIVLWLYCNFYDCIVIVLWSFFIFFLISLPKNGGPPGGGTLVPPAITFRKFILLRWGRLGSQRHNHQRSRYSRFYIYMYKTWTDNLRDTSFFS